MTELRASETLGQTGVTLSWVDQARVADVDGATDGFQILLGLTMLFGGAVIGGALILFAGVVHPVAMYLGLAVLITTTVVLGGVAVREQRRLRDARRRRDETRMAVPLSFSVVAAAGAPTFTAGLQEGPPNSITGPDPGQSTTSAVITASSPPPSSS